MNLDKLFEAMGGKENILSATNCMTRLRLAVKNEGSVDMNALQELEGVLGVVHDVAGRFEIVVGPGKARKYAEEVNERGVGGVSEDWQKNKAELRSKQKNGKFKQFLKMFGEIFVPLIPGTIVAGLCSGIAMLISQANPEYASNVVLNVIYQLLTVVNVSCISYIAAWGGYRAAERFGATPVLGGMLGLITTLDNVNVISQTVGLYNEASPLDSILRAGKGGVLAAIVGVYVLSKVEKWIRKRMPESMDIVFTPLLSMIICLVPYLFVFMPLLGYVSTGICFVFGKICMSEYLVVRALAGFLGSALFLPLVATGMHHGLVALYTVQLQQIGYVTLYPALAMAGAGQVGAAIAIWIKAKRVNDRKLISVIKGALPAGVLGVGEPLIYGVTLPMGRPFITAGIGAGFGGAFVMACEVAATTWGPSGVLGVFVMTAGPRGAFGSIACYLIGLLISYVAGGLITYFCVSVTGTAEKESNAANKTRGTAGKESNAARLEKEASTERISHEDILFSVGLSDGITYTITDKAGIHARPAAALVSLNKSFESEITITANGKTVAAESPVGIMSLNVTCGNEITVHANGADNEAALMAVQEFLVKNL